MFKQVIQYMIGVSLGRSNYIASLRDYKDLRFAGVTFIYAILAFLIGIFSTRTLVLMMVRRTFPTAEFGFFGFTIPVLLILTALFLIFWIYFTLMIYISALIVGARKNILPTFIVIGLTLPHFLISIVFLPAIIFLIFLVPQLIFLLILIPIIPIYWVTIVYKMGRQLYNLPRAHSGVMLFTMLAFTFMFTVLLWLLSPPKLVLV